VPEFRSPMVEQLARVARPQGRAVRLALLVAVALHVLLDSQKSLLGTAVVGVVSLVVLGITVHRSATAAWCAPTGRAERHAEQELDGGAANGFSGGLRAWSRR